MDLRLCRGAAEPGAARAGEMLAAKVGPTVIPPSTARAFEPGGRTEPAAAGGVAPVFTAPIKALGAGHRLCPSPAGGAGSSLSAPPGSRAPFGLFQLVLGSRHTKGKGVAGGCEGGRRQGAELSHPPVSRAAFRHR